ncbi:hypothetical protein ACGF07_04860 [Kitasatospora sp. NPDC048194]|uniref:hypothetical protein n=1 Tax=Kitasatospora sp. NPDC048194 TaxID=3364045 RepID=UPI0037145998
MSGTHFDDEERMSTEDIAAAAEKKEQSTGAAEQATPAANEGLGQGLGQGLGEGTDEGTGGSLGEGTREGLGAADADTAYADADTSYPTAGSAPTDAGSPYADAGSAPTDAGSPSADAGPQEQDTRAAQGGEQDVTGGPDGGDGREPLLPEAETRELRERWQQVQTDFVDDPREAVHTADALVADLMQRLAESFADRRRSLESQWNRGDSVETEELRVALQQYRTFFNRLLQS